MDKEIQEVLEGKRRWTVLTADCLDILPTLPDGCVDAVVTDPPFEVEAHTLQRRVIGATIGHEREVVSAPLPFAAITAVQRALSSSHCVRVCGGWMLTFCQAEAVSEWRDAIVSAGGSYRRAMVWVKPDGMPQYSGDRPGMGYESIVAAWCGQGKSTWNGGGRHGVFTHTKNDGDGPSPHPTRKPFRLMNELIRLFSDDGQIVLDPFAGSGSTGMACVANRRRFIGIEIDEGYASIARRRIAEADTHLFNGVGA